MVSGNHDTNHWLASPKREEFFGPLGITSVRTFTDPQYPARVALTMDTEGMKNRACR